MPGATEIYICRPGQAIKEGKVEYSDIATRADAEVDAIRRVRDDPSIAKIAYYRIKDDGGFRTLYSYDNPHATAVPERRSALDDLEAPPDPSIAHYSAKRQPSLLKRFRALLEED